MTATPALFDQLADALAAIHARLGEPPFADRRRTIALLADRLPEARREIRAIGTAIEEGVPGALVASERHLLGLEIDRLADRLEGTTGLRRDIARPIVRALAYGLGLGPLPSLYVDAPVTSPASGYQPGNWAGVSEPIRPVATAPSAATAPVAPPASAQRGKGGQPMIRIGDRSFPRSQAFAWSSVIAVVAIGLSINETRKSEPANVIVNPPISQQQVPPKGLAGEETDFGLPAKATLEPNVGTPTPLDIPVGKRLTTADLRTLLAGKSRTLLVDVLAQPHPQTLKSAHFVPIGGMAGTTTDDNQQVFAKALEKLTEGDKTRDLVFFCAGVICWESYNAALRAGAAGYRDIYWYRGGLASWTAAGLPMEALPAQIGAK